MRPYFPRHRFGYSCKCCAPDLSAVARRREKKAMRQTSKKEIVKAVMLMALISSLSFAADAPRITVMVPGDVATETGVFTPEALHIKREKQCVDDAATVKKYDESPPVVGLIIGGVLILAAGVAAGYGVSRLTK